MKSVSFLLLFFLWIGKSTVFAQLDKTKSNSKNGNISIGIPIKSKAAKTHKPVQPKSNNGFKNAFEKEKEKIKRKKEEEEFKNRGIITPALLRQQTLQKNLEKRQIKIPFADKDMGVFHTKAAKIYINAIDFGTIDGDIIDIYKNGVKIVSNYVLKRALKRFEIPIDLGFNRIEIVAVSEGEFRPNTGGFNIYDTHKEIISSDFWNLVKGAKVIALIIRD